jgi:UDP-3-O-acyl-N-acetylglucosamine deacetylase
MRVSVDDMMIELKGDEIRIMDDFGLILMKIYAVKGGCAFNRTKEVTELKPGDVFTDRFNMRILQV